jgi:hypothetical protein
MYFLTLLLGLIIIVVVGAGGIMAVSLMFRFLAHVVRSLSETVENAQAMAQMPGSITKATKECRYYGRMIMQTAEQYPPGPMRDRFNRTIKSVKQQLENLDRLEQGLLRIYSQCNPQREVRRANMRIDELRRQMLATEEQAHFQMLIASTEQHIAELQALQRFQEEAELKIRKMATDLAATHARILLLIAKGDLNGNRIRRLDENLQENLAGMRDMLSAMDELGYSRISSG